MPSVKWACKPRWARSWPTSSTSSTRRDLAAALLQREGELGALLKLIESVEDPELRDMSELLAQSAGRLSLDDLAHAEIAMRWQPRDGAGAGAGKLTHYVTWRPDTMEKPEGKRTCLYTPSQLDAVVDNMARQAAGLLTGRTEVVIVGILRRGAPLADLLHARLQENWGVPPCVRLDLEIKRYADDLRLLHPETRLTDNPAHATLDLSGRTVLVVDDVMYRGHSMLRAVEYLAGKQPAEIRAAVLVDRGVSSLPVRTDIVGVHLDVAPPDIIECNVPPYEEQFRIDLLQPERAHD